MNKEQFIKDIRDNIQVEKITIEDLGGISPRQIEFYFNGIKIGYMRCRYGLIELKPSKFVENDEFDTDYWDCIYEDYFGDFGDGNFINESHKLKTIENCKKALYNFYKYDYKV